MDDSAAQRVVDGAPARTEVPATVLTGFLGSGKTTLLRRALGARAFADTAVVINEVGEIAIDHYLVDIVAGEVVELPGGCLCCAVREDLARTLRGLIERRDAGEIRGFRRIVVETSGLADPAPILFTLGADPLLDTRLRLARVVTMVDAVAGAATLDRFAEATRQVAVADALVVSKTDLAPLGDALAARLDALNPSADLLLAADCNPAATLFACDSHGPSQKSVMPGLDPGIHEQAPDIHRKSVDGRVKPGHDENAGHDENEWEHAHHTHGIAAYAIVLGAPVGRLDFARALGGLARERGGDLLRVKGILAFADRPGRPAVVQAAQHAMLAPEWLDAWPDADRRSRLVFVVHDIAAEEILGHFAFAAPALIASHH
jgi:G3E family GTPase